MQKDKTKACARVRRAAAGLAAMVLLADFLATWPAAADTIEPFDRLLGNAEFTLGGAADAVGIASGGVSGSSAVRLTPAIERDYDSGLVIAADATLLVYRDRLSAGRYGGKLFERLAGEVRSGLGNLAVGLTDGAAHTLAVTGPKVDNAVSLDDPQLLLFRDSATGRPYNLLPFAGAVTTSSNYAKFLYTSPTLFGVSLALSFTPTESRQVLPFLHEGPQAADRQTDIWEMGVRYSDQFGPVLLSAYGGVAEGRAERKTAGHEGVSDLAAGARADYAVDDDVTFSLGGGFRQTNAYAFDINNALAASTTRATSTSASLTKGNWIAGLEYGNGVAGAGLGALRLGFNGYQAAIGYEIDENLRLTGGWQRQTYTSAGPAARIAVDAGFLHLDFHV